MLSSSALLASSAPTPAWPSTKATTAKLGTCVLPDLSWLLKSNALKEPGQTESGSATSSSATSVLQATNARKTRPLATHASLIVLLINSAPLELGSQTPPNALQALSLEATPRPRDSLTACLAPLACTV